jgi:hypothetical protein
MPNAARLDSCQFSFRVVKCKNASRSVWATSAQKISKSTLYRYVVIGGGDAKNVSKRQCSRGSNSASWSAEKAKTDLAKLKVLLDISSIFVDRR